MVKNGGSIDGDCMIQPKYFEKIIPSKGHTPIYKLHKYFARRPHNVFRALIEHYVPIDGLVVDCFGGGGVSLIEGLTTDRRVISYDLNPVASFIQYAQILEVSEQRVEIISNIIQEKIKKLFEQYYSTSCRNCGDNAHVRWFEHSYTIECPQCQKETMLDNTSKAKNHIGKSLDGSYICSNCNHTFRSSKVKRNGSKIINLRYKCDNCGTHETTTPNIADFQKMNDIETNKIQIITDYSLKIPYDEIPSYWDRQREDCLSSKGFEKFIDLFTTRNLLCSSYYFSVLDQIKNVCSVDEWNFMLLNVSALLRYTNNMTFSVNSWMDGRPVAWAKHAFWTPNQFIECNPIEYFNNRMKAAYSGIKDRKSRFSNKKSSFLESDVLSKIATHAIVNRNSAKMNLPDGCVDAVITDPPYGSNVQYGELCHFWSIWLRDKVPFDFPLFNLKDEVVVHRKANNKTKYSKNFDDYRKDLTTIYTECYRVLKPNGILVFTFNNKNPDAWFAMIKSALDAGFDLEPDGITFQEQINAYRDTAHLRFDGTAEGDFIYSFIKRPSKVTNITPNENLISKTNSCIKVVLDDFKKNGTQFSESELFIAFYKKNLANLVNYIKTGSSESDILNSLSFNNVLRGLAERNEFVASQSGWIIK